MKTVVITGGTRGIGRGLADSFLDRGCNVVITGRSAEGVDAAVRDLGQDDRLDRVAGTTCEVTDVDDLQALWSFGVEKFGSIDVWINNAGISIKRAPIWDQTPQELRSVIDVNLYGAVIASRTAIAGFLQQGHGQLWNMEGFGSDGQTQPGIVTYGASKRGVSYLVKGLVKETKNTPVQVCALSPGIVVTDLLIDDYEPGSADWERSKKFFNILGDTVETVTPWLADNILSTDKTGAKVAWLTKRKAMGRFMTSSFKKRDLFSDTDQLVNS
ncbi:MAG: SDR family NAD(P)-dependent oxidoreductase [Acidimicrobiia bacterium]